jgi:hypothetical protein
MKKLKINNIEFEIDIIALLSESKTEANQEDKCSCIFLSCRPKPE